jgi:hypothetical protein
MKILAINTAATAVFVSAMTALAQTSPILTNGAIKPAPSATPMKPVQHPTGSDGMVTLPDGSKRLGNTPSHTNHASHYSAAY